MLGSRWLGAFIGVALLALLLVLELLSVSAGPPPGQLATGGAPPPQAVFGAQFAAVPTWVKVWMKFQDMVIGALLLFVLWRKEAQIYGLAILASHIFLFAVMPIVPIEKLTLGFASLSHFFWIIPLVVFVRAWPSLDKATGYGAWVTVAIFQIVFSLVFDIPDGIGFIMSLL